MRRRRAPPSRSLLSDRISWSDRSRPAAPESWRLPQSLARRKACRARLARPDASGRDLADALGQAANSYAGPMLSHGPRSERMAVLALLAVTAVWGSTFFLIKDVVTRIPVADLLAVRFGVGQPRPRPSCRTAASADPPNCPPGCGSRPALRSRPDPADRGAGPHHGQRLRLHHRPLCGGHPPARRSDPEGADRPTTWAAVGLATIGLGVLSLNGFAIGYGELVTLVSAIVYAGHIVALGQVSTPATVLSLSLVQMVVITAVCGLLAVLPVSDAGLAATGQPCGLAGGRLSRPGCRSFDHGVADGRPGSDRAVPGGGDHGHGAGLGGWLRGGDRR